MDEIEVVIRIPKKCKEFLDNGGKVDWLDAIPIIDAIANGIVLPKGHGRLIDADELLKHNCIDVWTDYGLETKISGLSVDTAPTIIEADRRVEDAGSD